MIAMPATDPWIENLDAIEAAARLLKWANEEIDRLRTDNVELRHENADLKRKLATMKQSRDQQYAARRNQEPY